ncbi:MAG: IreB family regulatory phosphoprotein [Bacilli bacterium]
MNDNTSLFDVNLIKKANVTKTLNEVFSALQEKGYNPVNQIVGYLISGDPGYISSYKDARSKIVALDRSEIVAIILKEYLENK